MIHEKYCGYKPKIAVDIDDTLFVNNMVPDIIKEFGLPITTHSWDLHELGEIVLKELYNRFVLPKYMCELKPFDGAIDKMDYWNEQGYKICCVTARKPKIQPETLEMVRRYFPYVEDVYCAESFKSEYHDHKGFVSHPRFALDAGKNAALVANNCHVIIDDGGHNIEASMRVPWIKRYLISNPSTFYNHDFAARVLNENLPITVVPNISEVFL